MKIDDNDGIDKIDTGVEWIMRQDGWMNGWMGGWMDH
jgi:hypothetical protein